MSNPINWGETPFANGAVRGFLAAIITGLLYAIYELQKGVTIEQAAMAGAVPMLIAFLALLGYGAADQARANSGTVIASDVPVQIEAKVANVDGVPTFGDMPPGSSRGAKGIAEFMTRKYKRFFDGR